MVELDGDFPIRRPSFSLRLIPLLLLPLLVLNSEPSEAILARRANRRNLPSDFGLVPLDDVNDEFDVDRLS